VLVLDAKRRSMLQRETESEKKEERRVEERGNEWRSTDSKPYAQATRRTSERYPGTLFICVV